METRGRRIGAGHDMVDTGMKKHLATENTEHTERAQQHLSHGVFLCGLCVLCGKKGG